MTTLPRTGGQGARDRREQGVRALVRRHPLAAFVLLAYGLSWSVWAIALAGGGGLAILAVGAFGPAAAAALVLRAEGRPLGPWAGRIVRWRVPGRYYLYALGLPPALFAAANLVLAALGEEVHPARLGGAIPAYLATFVLVALIGGGQEEPGWRGFALDRLQARHSPLLATALLGLVWGLWHLPIYGLAFVGPMLFVVFYTWLWNRTGSVLLCVLLHGSFTPALDHMILADDGIVVDAVILGTLLAGAVAIILLTRGRLGLARPGAPAGGPM